MQIEHKGMLVEVSIGGYEPATREYPGCPAMVEQTDVRVSDWDEFAAWWGAENKVAPTSESIEKRLERLSEAEWPAIEEAAWKLAEQEAKDWDGDPDDFEPPEWDDIMGDLY